MITAKPEGQVRPYATTFMDGDTQVSQSQANQDARFSVLVAHQKKYKGLTSGMKLVNPENRVFIYSNGTANVRTDLPNEMYAHDVNGKRISITGWPQNPTLLMEPSNQAWRDYLSDLAMKNLTGSGYDGIYIDVLGPAGVSVGYVAAVPVNQQTGKQYTKLEWLNACRDLATYIKTKTGKEVFGNGWGNGPAYFNASAPTSIMTSKNADGVSIDAGEPEGWLRGATQSVSGYPNETRWLQEVAMQQKSTGVAAMVMCKLWTSWTPAQRDAWLEFAVATYLMGNKGLDHIMFTDMQPAKATTWRPNWYDLNLGSSSTAMMSPSVSLYRRTFQFGVVYVNMSSGNKSVDLGGTYTRVPSTNKLTTLTLAPKSAAVLKVV